MCFNLMAAITRAGILESPEIKSVTVFIVSPFPHLFAMK